MPHADTSVVPDTITTKQAFYEHVIEGLTALVEDQSYWVTNLANASSLLYHCFLNSSLYGSRPDGQPVINWCGFYLRPPPYETFDSTGSGDTSPLLLGPFNGRPACQLILPRPGRGVCADAFLSDKTLIVPDVHEYPGHIACDVLSASEIVLPLRSKEGVVVGVLDLDSTVKRTFDEADRVGLERIVELLRIS